MVKKLILIFVFFYFIPSISFCYNYSHFEIIVDFDDSRGLDTVYDQSLKLKLNSGDFIESYRWNVHGYGYYESYNWMELYSLNGAGNQHEKFVSDNQASIIGIDASGFTNLRWKEILMTSDMPELEELIIPEFSLNFGESELDLFEIAPNLKKIDITYCNYTPTTAQSFDSLESVACDANGFKLSDLYFFSEKISDPYKKKLGKQSVWEFFSGWHLTTDTFDLREQYILGGVTSNFEIRYGNLCNGCNSSVAVEGIDYSNVNGKLIFHKPERYEITITNSAIVSHPSFPASFTFELEVNELAASWSLTNDADSYEYSYIAENTDAWKVNFMPVLGGWTYWGLLPSNVLDTFRFSYSSLLDTIQTYLLKPHSSVDYYFLDLEGKNVFELTLEEDFDSIKLGGNNLTLEKLFVIKNKITYPNGIDYGEQVFKSIQLELDDTVNLEGNYLVNGIPSEINVVKNNNPAIEGEDYSFENGLLIFLENGLFEVSITNDAFLSTNLKEPEFLSGDINTPKVKMLFTVGSDVITSNDRFDFNELSVYPNPTSGIIHLYDTEIVQVYSSNGKLIISRKSNVIDLTGYSNGIYFLKIKNKTIKVFLNK